MKPLLKKFALMLLCFCLLTTTSAAATKPRIIIDGRAPQTRTYTPQKYTVQPIPQAPQATTGISVLSINNAANAQSDRSFRQCQALLFDTLKLIPDSQYYSLTDLTLDFAQNGHRGSANATFMKLRCANISSDELKAVLIHEIGHVVDGGYLKGYSTEKSNFVDLGVAVAINDPSLNYYQISWKNNSNWISNTVSADFCSGYGSSNPYEDFAECYLYYVLHGKEFRQKAQTNHALQKKYNFIKNTVFNGREYNSGQSSAQAQNYDITKLALI